MHVLRSLGACLALVLLVPAPAAGAWLPPHDVGRTNMEHVVAAPRADGGAAVLWLDWRSGRLGVRTADVTADGRASTAVSLPSGRRSIGLRAGAARSGAQVACWIDNRARLGDRVIAAVRPAGVVAWQTVAVPRTRASVNSLACGVDDRGDAIVAWSARGSVLVQHVTGGALSGSPQRVAGVGHLEGNEYDGWLELAVAGDGSALLAIAELGDPIWEPHRHGGGMRVVYRPAGGAFGGDTTLGTERATMPAVLADDAGGFTLAWAALDELLDPVGLRIAAGPIGAVQPVQLLDGAFDATQLAQSAGRTLLTAVDDRRRLVTSVRPPGGAFPTPMPRATTTSVMHTGALIADGSVLLAWQARRFEYTGPVRAAVLGPGGHTVSTRRISPRQRNITPHIQAITGPKGALLVWTEPADCRPGPRCGDRIRVAAYR